VTGGTGLLGNNIIRQCLHRGWSVTALVRDRSIPKSLAELNVTLVQGDLNDRQALSAGVGQSDAIVHAAAHIHLGWKFLDEAMQVNLTGTENVIAAALEHNKPMVHISTVNTLPVATPDSEIDETSKGPEQVPCTYVVSKRAAENAVYAAIEKGLRAYMVHPGYVLGPWDWKPSSGRMIVELSQRWTPISPAGGCSVCDARDVANGILAVLERGTPGRPYILAGQNMTYFELWTRFAKVLGKRPPVIHVRALGRFIGSRWADCTSRFRTGESDLNTAAMMMSSQFHYYSSQRAKDELGYQSRTADQTIHDAVKWLVDYGYVAKKTTLQLSQEPVGS
jgi:dihydroflavonol-4-reductase